MKKGIDIQPLKICLLTEKSEGVVYKFLVSINSYRKELPRFVITEELDTADVLIVYVKNPEWGWNTIKTLRSQVKFFLRPILLICEQDMANIAELVDATITSTNNEILLLAELKKAFSLVNTLNQLADIPPSVGDVNLKKIMILRYLYSRPDFVLTPLRNYHASVGYSFPLIQLLLKTEAGKELKQIEELFEAQLLTTKLVDKVNVCPYCEHSQINYRELCPHCHSLNISEETTIHHFRCAYVGRESEFRKGFHLSCPKCSRDLKHVGVDYDKPADVLWCNECNHNFSEPLLSCFCLVCGKTFSPEDAFIKEINELRLSQDGIRAAEEGVLPGFGIINILKKELGFYKQEVFMEFLRIESFRCRRYNYHSTFSKVNFSPVHQAIGGQSLKHSRKLRNNFATILNETFRSTDLFTDLTNGEILTLFTNTSVENAKIAFDRLNHSLNDLLKTRIELNFTLSDLAQDDKSMQTVMEVQN